MDQCTSLQIGGPADALVFPQDEKDLEALINTVRETRMPYLIMGKGTNLLVRDRGIRELVVNLSSGFRQISSTGERIRVGAGTLLNEMINFAMERGLSGLTPLYGIPGTVGGGLAMNAGAWGSEVKERIESITVLNGNGRVRQISREDLLFRYRELHLPEGTIIIEGTLLMEPQKKENIQEEIAFYQRKRRETQPLQSPSAGSIFRNPPGTSAGKIIEELGLKGKKVGGAEVSRIHGNFIINTGNASASHVLELIHLIQKKAFQERGITLEPEVRIVGE
jgi:UDP-N-acetylmuramate dehydrogenase